jgi:hypothetical protein
LIIGTAVSAFGSAVVAVALIVGEKGSSCFGKEMSFMATGPSRGKEEGFSLRWR